MNVQMSSVSSVNGHNPTAAPQRKTVDATAAAADVGSSAFISISRGGTQPPNTAASRSAEGPLMPVGGEFRRSDYTNMTPAEMQGVAQDLYNAGKLDITELFMLQNAGMPLGQVGPNGEFEPLTEGERAAASAKPVDYLQTFKDGIKFLEQTGYALDPKSGYESMKHILATLQGTHT